MSDYALVKALGLFDDDEALERLLANPILTDSGVQFTTQKSAVHPPRLPPKRKEAPATKDPINNRAKVAKKANLAPALPIDFSDKEEDKDDFTPMAYYGNY